QKTAPEPPVCGYHCTTSPSVTDWSHRAEVLPEVAHLRTGHSSVAIASPPSTQTCFLVGGPTWNTLVSVASSTDRQADATVLCRRTVIVFRSESLEYVTIKSPRSSTVTVRTISFCLFLTVFLFQNRNTPYSSQKTTPSSADAISLISPQASSPLIVGRWETRCKPGSRTAG